MHTYTSMTATAGATESRQKAEIWSLVLWAAGIPHALVREEDQWEIKVEPAAEEYARRELALFEEENRNWPPTSPFRAEADAAKTAGQPPTVLMMGALVIIYAITGPWSDNSPWFEQGAVMGRQILEHGQWWRVITGLTLHANPVHLWGNVLVGGVLAHFFCKSVGSGLGWTLILLAGALGNYINILLHGATHNSVGFSTAVFGTIGLLTGRQCVMRRAISGTMLLPLAAGFALLAMLGAGGEHTDLGAHFFGLAAGLFLGTVLEFFSIVEKARSARGLQSLLLAGSILLVTFCWLFALKGSHGFQ